MAIIYNSATTRTTGTADLVRGSIPLTTIRADIARYWGPDTEEFHVSTFVQLRERTVITALWPTGHVALKVKNLTDPRLVSAEWVRFDDGHHPADPDFTYFVLTTSEVERIIVDRGDATNAITARIGRDINDNIYVYCHRTQVVFEGGGTGGDGYSAGARIPSN